MSRKFKTVDYEATLLTSVRLDQCLPANHLARFIVEIIQVLDFSELEKQYGNRGGMPYHPKMLLAILVYAYTQGIFSSRKIEQATLDTAAFRYLAGNDKPDHDTFANFRKTFLPELKNLFTQVLLLAQEMGLLKLGNVSLDGSKIHADASRSKAVSHKRLLQIEVKLKKEIEELFALAEQADNSALPEGMSLPFELQLRNQRLQKLAEAKTVLEERAKERFVIEQAEYEEKMRLRAENEIKTGKKPRGKPLQPPSSEPNDGDQYNFTDPDSRIMKENGGGFNQDYNAQIAVDQGTNLIVGFSLSNHPNDQNEIQPTLDNMSIGLGKPSAIACDTGYFSAANIELLDRQNIDPFIAPKRESHYLSLAERFGPLGEPPGEDASPSVKMAYKLRTTLGRAIYGLRKSTVEPVFGQIKAIMGFRQFSLRGIGSATDEWCLVCLALNMRRIHVLSGC